MVYLTASDSNHMTEAEVLCYLSTERRYVPSRRLNDRTVLEAATQQHNVKVVSRSHAAATQQHKFKVVSRSYSHSSKPAYTSRTCDKLHKSMAFTQLYDSYVCERKEPNYIAECHMHLQAHMHPHATEK